ncbi:hypothetical protein BDZ89DRAFT_1159737 [Hymenopellis radicata]|nr:hypothetical protein BDZ89DRAFT_1159737 [Hymenopellis radicata]
MATLSSLCPSGCRDVGIRLFDGSRRHLWDRLVPLDDFNMFNLALLTCPDATFNSGRRSSASAGATVLSSHGPTFMFVDCSLRFVLTLDCTCVLDDLTVAHCVLKSSITIKTSMPSGLASPTASLTRLSSSSYSPVRSDTIQNNSVLKASRMFESAKTSQLKWLSKTMFSLTAGVDLLLSRNVGNQFILICSTKVTLRHPSAFDPATTIVVVVVVPDDQNTTAPDNVKQQACSALYIIGHAPHTFDTLGCSLRPLPTLEEAPLPAEEDGELDPEDFAREVMIELMRNTLDNLKDADTLREKTEVLTEIQKIMLQDASTKEVFRELDGFIMLMSVLSTLRVAQDGPIHEPEEQILLEVLESIRLVFMIVSDAIHDSPENAEYFKESVGFKSLSLAIRDLVSDKRTVDITLGFLLSMSLNDFALSALFTTLRSLSMDQVDTKIHEFETRLIIIRQPDAIRLLWDSAPRLVDGSPVMRYAIYKLFELLCASCHRNHATLSTMGLVQSLLSQYFQLRDDKNASDKERQVAQRLLRRLLELGAYTDEARRLFQRTVNAGALDLETLEIVRAAIKSRWLEHFSLESPAELCMEHAGTRGVPSTGFTFAIWLWIEVLPKSTSHPIFTVRVNKNLIVALSVRPDGKLELRTSGNKTVAVFNKSSIPKMRWCHITLVHHAHRSSQPSIRLFIDGVMNDSLTWAYPKSLFSATSTEYVLGSEDADAQMSWCIATAYFVSLPIGDDLPRFIHHLGPRYQGNFQDPSLIKFLTYEASTSLNRFLTAVASKGSAVESMSLMKAVRDGLGLSNSAIVFSLSCLNSKQSGSVSNIPMSTSSRESNVRGDVLVVKAACLDSSLWKIGGTAIRLHLLQLAKSPHEISRTLSILTDCIRNSWENSEDMERLRGYEISTDILRSKAQMINMTSFETLFESIGLNFRTPEQSTVNNVVVYKAIALDFEFWSHARREIQHVYFEHFITLLEVSRYKAFNMRQRLSKLGLVRRFLFVLQTEWFDTNSASSPHSIISRIDYSNAPQKAEQVLEIFVSLLSNLDFYNKIITALPVMRICLLLIGDRPQPFVATQVLRIIAISIRISVSFTRKFELISGWSVLKTALPECWDSAVNEAAFDVLLGRTPKSGKSRMDQDSENTVICPQIVPTILSALQTGLRSVVDNCGVSDEGADDAPHFSRVAETTMERIVEDLLDLHASSATFKQIFRSQQTTRLFIESYRAFVLQAPLVNQRSLRLLEKIAHLGISLAVDSAVAAPRNAR